ncbi:MAG: hypothetical protein EBX37_18860, partial [Alphaproteobacteria bacterium]|nr:hypothetical protein [Alphaproteobacteria bacterium]
ETATWICDKTMSLSLQRWVYDRSGIGTRPMIFDVRPQSWWMAFSLLDRPSLERRIPPDLELVPVSVFRNQSPREMVFLNIFQVDSPHLRGNRLEIVTTVCEKRDPLRQPRFLIIDYFSDTISSDPVRPFKLPDASVFSISISDACSSASKTAREEMMTIMLTNEEKTPFWVRGTVRRRKNEVSSSSSSSDRSFLFHPSFIGSCNQKIFYGSSEIHPPNDLQFSVEDLEANARVDIHDVFHRFLPGTIGPRPDFSFVFLNTLRFTIVPSSSPSQE